jgi:hypothetical protein
MNELIGPFFGYAASVLLAISLLVSNALKFRWINILGCLSFIIYGLYFKALPVIISNGILLIINIYQLFKLYSRKEDFEFAEIQFGNELINRFLDFYKADIQSYFPAFKYEDDSSKISFVVLRDIVIANIFTASILEGGAALVEINYTIPHYRDYKVGKFIFESGKGFLLSKGIKSIVYEKVANKEHLKYLKKMGFTEANINGKTGLRKDLV